VLAFGWLRLRVLFCLLLLGSGLNLDVLRKIEDQLIKGLGFGTEAGFLMTSQLPLQLVLS